MQLQQFASRLQYVHTTAVIPLTVTDLQELSPSAQQATLQAWLAAEAHRPFVWTQPPLLRVQVFVLDAARWQCAFSFHHAILDGWSAAALATELLQYYEAPAAARPPLQAAYRTFIAMEQTAAAAEDSIQFWTTQLAGAEPLALPRLTSENEVGDGVGLARSPLAITPAQNATLTSLARALGVSARSVLLALHVKALSLLTGQRDVITGLVLNGRPEVTDGDALLGLFLNTVPFRIQLAAEESWTQLIATLAAQEQALWPHRRVPLPELHRRHGAIARFETLFNYTHFHVFEQLDPRSSCRRHAAWRL